MSLAYFRFYVDDYEAQTVHLTIEEDGAYNRLLRLCWRSPGCSIPADHAWIRRRMRLNVEDYERVCVPILEEFFMKARKRYFQKDLKAEYESASASYKAAVANGSKGGRKPKQLKKAANVEPNPSDQLKPNGTQPKGNQNQNQNKEESSSSAHDAPDHGNGPSFQIEDVPTGAPVPPHSSPDPDAALRATVVAPAPPAPPGEAEIMAALQAYNDAAHRNGLKAAVMPLDETRRQKLADRIEAYGLDRWLEALSKIDSNAFLRGDAVPGVQADLTYLLKPDTIPRILEGNFDERPKPPRKPRTNGSGDRGSSRGQHADADDGPATSIAQILARDRRREQGETGRRDGDQDHDRRDAELSGGSAGGGVVIDAVAGFTN